MRVNIETVHGQVADTIENHYAGKRPAPPEGHPNSRECPQCHAITWRLTQWCVHCGADLFAIDGKERDRRVAIRGLKFGLVFFLIGGAAFYGQTFLQPPARLWAMGFGTFSMILAVAVMKN